MRCDDFIMQNVDMKRDGYSPAEVAEIVEGAWNEALSSYHEFRQRSGVKPFLSPDLEPSDVDVSKISVVNGFCFVATD